MAGSVNKVILIGNLGRDPEIRRTQSGDPIATLNIATSETWKDKQSGERKEKTEWHRVVIFQKGAAEFAEKYLKKGAKVYAEGELATRKWTDKNNIERFTTEIVIKAFSGTLQSLDSGSGNTPPPADSTTSEGRSLSDLDDEIPF
jgi:single-strand DNA-binding protein